MNRIIKLLLLIAFASCNTRPSETRVLDSTGIQQAFQQTIAHFKKGKDSLKLQAAMHLINQLPFYETYERVNSLEVCFDSIAGIATETPGRRELFERMLQRHIQGGFPPVAPSHTTASVITADFLINNIDLAFKAWRSIPAENRAPFNDFCNYVLPFSCTNEPVEPEARKLFFNTYKWIYNSLAAGVSFKQLADSIIRSTHYINMTSITKYHPTPLSASQVTKSRLGLCDDGVNYFVNLFRSLGIVCAKDYIVQWGNHHISGHSWIYLQYGSFTYATDIGGDGVDVRTRYAGESIPKVYREVFSAPVTNQQDPGVYIPARDVTSLYTPTISLELTGQWQNNSRQYRLAVFNGALAWRSIAAGSIENQHLLFHNAGTNCVYLIGYISNNRFNPVSYPFFIHADKQLRIFRANGIYDSIKVIRKTGLATARNRTKTDWIYQVQGCVIEGSNDSNFISSTLVCTIPPFFSTQQQVVNTSCPTPFRYIRFRSPGKESYLSYLRFINARGQEIQGTVMARNIHPNFPVERLFDKDLFSFSGGKDYYAGYRLQQPEQIAQIRFQPRNDDNAVRSGDKYSLYCWQQHNWQLLESQVAADTLLYFHKVPRNSLLVVKNNTRGIEHMPFSMDASGMRQIWHGFLNF